MRKKLEQIAVDAGEIVREAVRKEYRIENKSGVGNYVTEIDVRIQEFLQSALCECWHGNSASGCPPATSPAP